MKIQSLLLTLILFTLFACKKKDESEATVPEPEVKLLQKLIMVNQNTGISTYYFKYNSNNLVEEISCENGAEVIWKTVYKYDSDKRIEEIKYSEYANTVTANYKYEEGRIIETLNEAGSDSIVYTTNTSGNVVKEEVYVFGSGSYALNKECTYDWSGNNVTGINFQSTNGYSETNQLTFDTKTNPLYFFNGFASKSENLMGDLFPICFMKNNILTNNSSNIVGISQNQTAEYIYEADGYPESMELTSVVSGTYGTSTQVTFYIYDYK